MDFVSVLNWELLGIPGSNILEDPNKKLKPELENSESKNYFENQSRKFLKMYFPRFLVSNFMKTK